MSVPFKELAGSPVETYSSDGLVAERKILCAWDDRQAMVAELLGEHCGFGDLSRASYPRQSAILVKSVKVEPFYGRPDDQGEFNAVDTQLNTYSGQLAALTIEYELADIGVLADTLSIEPGTFLTYQTSVSTEHVAVCTAALQCENSPETTVTDEITPSLRVPVIEHQLTWHGVSRPPWDSIRACSGCVNAAAFLGAAEETVLFDGVTADREFIQIDSSGQPQYAWRLIYVFRERTVKYTPASGQTPVAYGWNHAYCSSAGYQRLVNAAGGPLYSAADFSALFIIPETP